MFEGPEFPDSLDEELFDSWFEKGRQSRLQYKYLLIIWDEVESAYQPVYVESRDNLNEFKKLKEKDVRESLVAAYDLYSESRII